MASSFRDVLSLGKSRPWPEVMNALTNGRTSRLEAAPLLQYFAPLQAWLESQNRGQFVGWGEWGKGREAGRWR